MASPMKENENTFNPDNGSDGSPLLPIESLIHVIRGQQVMMRPYCQGYGKTLSL